MGWITIDLDEETEGRMRAFAKAQGISLDRWVAELIREETAKLASGSADAPSVLGEGTTDLSREP